MSDIILTENANVIKRWKWKIKCEWECKQKLKENVKLKEENENENKNENENEDEDDIIKILIHLNEYDEETNQNKKNKIIKKLNDHLDEIIDESKSFADQIKSIKKVENLDDYYCVNDFDDKELKFKIFKLKLPHLSNEID